MAGDDNIMYLEIPYNMKKGEYAWMRVIQSPEEILRAMREGRVVDMETGEKVLVNDTTEDNLCYGEADGGAAIIDAWCDGYQEGKEVRDMDEENTDWSDGYSEGYKNGKINGRLESLESFLTIPLNTKISFELSEFGRQEYRKGLWRTLRILYGNYLHLMANDRLSLSMSLLTFAKIFGGYARDKGVSYVFDLVKDGSVRLNQVTINFDAKKLTGVREVTLSDEIL